MAYEVFVRTDAGEYLPSPLPDEFKIELRAILADIGNDPAIGRKPPCPPFAPHGKLVERWVDFNKSRHMLRVFYEVDVKREQVGVTHISVQPRPG